MRSTMGTLPNLNTTMVTKEDQVSQQSRYFYHNKKLNDVDNSEKHIKSTIKEALEVFNINLDKRQICQ